MNGGYRSIDAVGGGADAATPNVLMEVYSSGWVETRPTATHVIAVGHTSAPSWLTAADVWLEDVS